MIHKYVYGFLIWAFYRLWSFTWRVQIEEPPEMQLALRDRHPIILAHWHGDELVLVNWIGHYRIATIASTSKDGEMMNTVIRLFGAKTSRGSSTRGAVGAFKGLLALAKKGHNISFAVDGPKGPIYKVKPGVFETSRVLNAPIFVAGIYCSSAIEFPKSWNQTYLPKPFAKIQIAWVGPWGPMTRDLDPRDPNIAQNLEGLLHGAKHHARKVFAAVDP